MKMKSPLVALVLLTLSLSLTGCSSSKKQSADSDGSAQSEDMSSSRPLELNGDSDSGKAGALQTVFFDFNSANLSSETRQALDANAEFLKGNTNVQIQVEGHCDERGSKQYNIALGEKRAKAVKTYLTSMGVKAARVTTITYGKERPIAFGHDEAAWAQNRRANFVVTAK